MTQGGGANNLGTAFSLTPPRSAGDAWTEHVLYNFTGGSDGGGPLVGLRVAPDGVLYGASYYGAADNGGVVFSLTPPTTSGQPWTLTVLHTCITSSGTSPDATLLLARSTGTLYGTTSTGGSDGDGTVFQLKPPSTSGGDWTYTVLHDFTGAGGAFPNGRLARGDNGTFYGVTTGGGSSNDGTAFALTPSRPGQSVAAGIHVIEIAASHDPFGIRP